MAKFAVIGCAVCSLLFFGCCAQQQFAGIPVDDDRAVLITSVPPLLQIKNVSCGPTCLASVMAYWGRNHSDLLTNATQELSADNTADDLAALAGKAAFRAIAYRGNIQDLEHNMREGRPLLALVPRPKYDELPKVTVSGVPLSTIWDFVTPRQSHWIVVIGYTPHRIIVHDPAYGRVALDRVTFTNWWEQKKTTCLLVVPQ